MKSTWILVIGVLAVSSLFSAEGAKPQKNSGINLVPCSKCMTGSTIELRTGGGEKIKVDSDNEGAWGFADDNVDVSKDGQHIALFGLSVQGFRFVILDMAHSGRKIIDLRYQDIREAQNEKKWLVLEDSGYRAVAPHAVWLIDLTGKVLAKKIFDLFDPLLGGVKDPTSQLANEDGVEKMFWMPRQAGALVSASISNKTYLYAIKNTSGKKPSIKKIQWNADEKCPREEPAWLNDNICEFRFRDGHRKRITFR